jgi:hypothetical protein
MGARNSAVDELGALHRTEQVRDGRKGAALEAAEEQRRASRGIDAALDLRGLQVRIDLRVDANELALLLEVVHAIAEGGETHRRAIVRKSSSFPKRCVLFGSAVICKEKLMAKGQQKPKKNNKPKMTVAEKKAKKKDKKK